MKSYGEKTPDGRGFIKNEEVLNNFIYTQAFSDIYMELATDDTKASEFVNGVMPKLDSEKMKALAEAQKTADLKIAD